MKTDRIIAFALIGLCFLAVLAGLFFQRNNQANEEAASDSGSFAWDGSGLMGKADIAVIDVSGPIMYGSEGGFGATNADANQIITTLEQVRKDKVKGLLIRLNSPGGTASASQAIYEKILSMKKSSNIKVYSLMQDVAASGAYYIASASDVIYSHPSTMTGSIGVIMQIPNYSELSNKIGFQTTTIKSGKYKDIGNGARKMADDERKLLQDMIDDTYNEFVKAVAAGRKLPVDRVKQLADGRIYTGNQAKAGKLVDALGSQDDVVAAMGKVLKIEGEPKLKNYTKASWERIFSGIGSRFSLTGQLGAVLDTPELSPKFNKIPLMLYK